MGLITNGMVLLFSLFVFNYIYALLRRPASKIPSLQPSWTDFITWKPLQTILDQGYRTVSLGLLALDANANNSPPVLENIQDLSLR